MPTKSEKTPKRDEEREDGDEFEIELEEEELEVSVDDEGKPGPVASRKKVIDEDELDPLDDESGEEEEETQPASASTDKGPKINFDYDDGGKQVQKPEREETLEDLANKYRGSEDMDEERPVKVQRDIPEGSFEADEEEREIPRMRAQMPTSGIYSAQDVRRSSGSDLHQAPFMRSSYASGNNNSPRPNKSSKLHFVVLAIIGLVVLGSAVYLLKYQFKPTKPEPTGTPAPIVEATVAPSPTPQALDRSQYTIRVLNGTTTPKIAGELSTKLEELGYKIEKAGNNSDTDIKRTEVVVKKGNEALGEQLVKDIAPTYDATVSADLDSDTLDAQVIIGAK